MFANVMRFLGFNVAQAIDRSTMVMVRRGHPPFRPVANFRRQCNDRRGRIGGWFVRRKPFRSW
jgi:hypothetical protein